ncbi:MAG: ABC transporter ATP-binding protein [Acidobacteria bacterium]|nr:ABC transporter ATP-binding protein [Acidobacteriota bacterium]
MSTSDQIIFDNVSRFYGEVLGVNRVNLSIPPGITSLVGPNGSGKTTLMNLMTGLVRPTRGQISVRGIAPNNPEALFRIMGYCTQFDSFPRGYTGFQFVHASLLLQGMSSKEAESKAWRAIDKVNLVEAAKRKVAAYSKGMRQRIRLAQSIAHEPQVLILDEPLNGLDPLVRSETIALFREQAERGAHVIVSSHVLHEVDMISDQVILLANGYVVAEGAIRGVREEISDRPHQIVIRCDQPSEMASRIFQFDHVVEARIHPDFKGILVKTTNASHFHKLLNRLVMEGINIETIAPADDDVNSLYEYLIGDEGGQK